MTTQPRPRFAEKDPGACRRDPRLAEQDPRWSGTCRIGPASVLDSLRSRSLSGLLLRIVYCNIAFTVLHFPQRPVPMSGDTHLKRAVRLRWDALKTELTRGRRADRRPIASPHCLYTVTDGRRCRQTAAQSIQVRSCDHADRSVALFVGVGPRLLSLQLLSRCFPISAVNPPPPAKFICLDGRLTECLRRCVRHCRLSGFYHYCVCVQTPVLIYLFSPWSGTYS